jgi:cell division protein FtsI (penicillin-binding protein 3)
MAQNQAADAAQVQKDQQAASQAHSGAANSLSEKVLAAFHANGNTTSVIKDEKVDAGKPIAAPTIQPQVQEKSNGGVVVDAGKRVAVPDFHGADLRAVVEHAGSLGLRVQPIGSGLAREQAPAAGTMVPLGTQVVVRFAR